MDRRISRLISALGPEMNPIQAEGLLHVTAFTCNKSLEALAPEDWPRIEASVRDALHGTESEQHAEVIIDRMRTAFLEESSGPGC